MRSQRHPWLCFRIGLARELGTPNLQGAIGDSYRSFDLRSHVRFQRRKPILMLRPDGFQSFVPSVSQCVEQAQGESNLEIPKCFEGMPFAMFVKILDAYDVELVVFTAKTDRLPVQLKGRESAINGFKAIADRRAVGSRAPRQEDRTNGSPHTEGNPSPFP